MLQIKVGAATLNQTPFDWAGNSRRIKEAIDEARRQDVTILCLPELCISGYGCEDAFFSPGLHKASLDVLAELLPETVGMVVSFGLPLFHRNGLFNTACLAVDGRAVGFVAKQNLAGEGIHYEPRWFKAWPVGVHDVVRFNGEELPIGDIYFDCGGCRIGYEICEDAWSPHRPGAALAVKGVDLILCPSASHFAFDKLKIRRGFVLEGSRAFRCSYVFANLVGNEAGRAIYDGGAMIATKGSLLAQGPRLVYSETHVTSATIDLAATRMAQASVVSLAPAVISGDDCVRAEFTFPEIESVDAQDLHLPGWEQSPQAKEEEFTRAVSLALFDYLRKSRSRGFVVSLSGGADSAACATLVAFMVAAAVEELGLEAFKHRLAYISWPEGDLTVRDIVGRVLTCAYQATRNSSDVTREAARRVAEGVGARFLVLTVDTLVDGYIDLISNGLGRPLAWATDDIALQNIQARARAPSVWLIANIEGALLLATSNRSEAAVGYATMDGDTCGGLSPIAGIDKAFLRQWLRWMASDGPEGFSALEFLDAVNAQQPTAELRPQEAGQTDEDDLMPYEVLDAIERAAIRDKLSPVEAWHAVKSRLTGYDAVQLGEWVDRFFRLFCRNQWKRERYAPSFHLDDENLDPKTWCRFPILSGGFERELAMLKARLEAEKNKASPG